MRIPINLELAIQEDKSISTVLGFSCRNGVSLAQEPGRPFWRARHMTKAFLLLCRWQFHRSAHMQCGCTLVLHLHRTKGHCFPSKLDKQ